MKRRLAQLPLHTGQAPPWLFRRMVRLAGAVTMAVVDEFGPQEMLRRLADPWWFQAFGCVLGFDWHSSGVTTVTCGALKEAARHFGPDLGILVAGGKGATSRRTPDEIATAADRYGIAQGDELTSCSRLSAKVDSAAVQDGYQLYHHTFIFTPQGQWCVIQQGMNERTRWARRYHWLGETVHDFVCEPHHGIDDLGASPAGEAGSGGNAPARRDRQLALLNMVAAEAGENRRASVRLVHEHPDWLMTQIRRWTEGPTLFAPQRHRLLPADVRPERLQRLLRTVHETHPEDFRTLLGTRGVGPAAVRSLALLAELIYQAPVSRRDPALRTPNSGGAQSSGAQAPSAANPCWADYAYAHGGKDGTPFPVDRSTYDTAIAVLTDAVRRARLGQNEKAAALKRLASWDRAGPLSAP